MENQKETKETIEMKMKFIKDAMEGMIEKKGNKIEIVSRQGDARKIYDPVPLKITGTITAPAEYIKSKLWLSGDEDAEMTKVTAHISQNHCLLEVNREEATLVFHEDEIDKFSNTITGKMMLTDEFKRFGINSYDYVSTRKMAEFFKMHRNCFESLSEANEVVNALMNFQGKATKDVASKDNNRGNVTRSFEQKLESNIPAAIHLWMKVFKGMEKMKFEVEVYINPDNLQVALISPAVEDLKSKMIDEAIDEQINVIREVAPKITILEV